MLETHETSLLQNSGKIVHLTTDKDYGHPKKGVFIRRCLLTTPKKPWFGRYNA